MQNLCSSFRRSRNLTKEDMKTQSSLEVPKQIRSASFDENQLGKARGTSASALLAVPQNATGGARSRSFDSAGPDDTSHLEVPRFWKRRLGKKSPIPCVHCEQMKSLIVQQSRDFSTSDRVFESSSTDDDNDDDDSDNDDDDEYDDDDDGYDNDDDDNDVDNDDDDDNVDNDNDHDDDEDADDNDGDDESDKEGSLSGPTTPPPQLPSPQPLFLLLPVSSPPPLPSQPSFEFELQLPSVMLQPPDDMSIPPQRRRSISRQEALFVEPTGNSLENVNAVEEKSKDSLVHDIYLAVPELKRDRAASVDSAFSKVTGSRAEEVNEAGNFLTVPGTSLRSHSVDIVLPTTEHARYKALALNPKELPPPSPTPLNEQPKLPIIQDSRRSGEGGARVLRSTPDWGEGAISGEHLWSPTSASGDCCYVGDAECQRRGTRLKCSACKIIAHQACIDILLDRVQFTCKPTFRDVGVRQYREQTATQHHWVHRRTEKGKCKACGKTLQAKLSFSSKEIVALSCAWCKDAYHNKESCFNLLRIGQDCSLGLQSHIIVPPSWIVKLPRKGTFKSSLRKSPKKKNASKKKGKDSKNEPKTFAIKPIPTAEVSPVIVFINPKSGGNQGAKLLQKFQWLLNPRQVFDLTQGGPGPGLELFRKVNNLRILACGGDGTVGWVLSVLDQIGMQPAVGVLPLGTGNDLARALGWGGGYEDEPISKILANIGESDTVLLDRWQLTVLPNAAVTGEDTSNSKPDLPLNVVNNYFSLGVDAHIALEFHEAREAHPEKFNSRIRNKLFYGTAGGKDLMQRKWKGLAELVTLECDGKDLTPVLKEHRVHAIVFLNIPSYGGGTHPWNKSGGTAEPSTEDGLIEVVGLTTYQLPLLQAGAHGTCICQCQTAKIVTTKVIPMQVDGEACRLNPSIITISRLNQAIMLAKKKPGRANAQQTTMEKLTLTVNLISMADYEKHHYDKELLKNTAECVGTLEVSAMADLEQLRLLIKKLLEESQTHSSITDWWFVDSVTAERFFRIDKAQENIHFPADIAHENIYILDAALMTPDTETTSVHPGTTATASLDRTGPSISLETTTGWSVSLDTSQSLDIPCAGISIDVTESHASESGPGSPVRIEDTQATSVAPVSPKISSKISTPAKPPLSPPKSYHSPVKSPVSPVPLVAQADSPPLCLSPQSKDHLPSRDSIAKFKTNLLEKTCDGLLKAAKTGNLELMKELDASGYSLLSIDSSGRTALHIAARYGQKNIVKYLIANAPSAIMNMQENETGQTALHKAATNGQKVICGMLVSGGASLTKPDHAGYTPRQLASRAGKHDVAAYLQSQEHFQLVSEDLETAV